jgi:hypothetical protein
MLLMERWAAEKLRRGGALCRGADSFGRDGKLVLESSDLLYPVLILRLAHGMAPGEETTIPGKTP